jgi:hypothetical protein
MAQRDETEDQEVEAPKPGLIVEDETMVGGTDKTTGAPVIRPKTPDGGADVVTEATDPAERR